MPSAKTAAGRRRVSGGSVDHASAQGFVELVQEHTVAAQPASLQAQLRTHKKTAVAAAK